MTTTYSTSNVFNQCATCEFWGAPRKLMNGYFRKAVKVDGDIEGECVNADSVFSRHQQPADSGCSKWLKWSELG
jgi:hypothetical protein